MAKAEARLVPPALLFAATEAISSRRGQRADENAQSFVFLTPSIPFIPSISFIHLSHTVSYSERTLYDCKELCFP